MRKIILYCFVVIVTLLLFVQPTFAQDIASDSAQVNYQLPYPGLLPDSPLYFLKALRDKIEEFLISDPQKKADFDLLSADKRLSMGIALFDKREYPLSESTISKGENYFDDGLKNIEEIEKQGKAVGPSILVSYDLSTKKHKEVLEGLVKQSNGDLKQKLLNDLKRVEKFIPRVSELKLKQQP